MKQELQNKLYTNYPVLFIQKDLSMSKTCMCWGVSVNDGWYGIIDKTCRDIVNYVNRINEDRINHNEQPLELPQFTQVKEKFGLLRIYIDFVSTEISDAIYRMIDQAENASSFVCEDCGTTINVSTSGSWLLTLCDNCRQNRYKITPFFYITRFFKRIKYRILRLFKSK